MADRRWNDVADILVNYSTRVRPGEKVLITMMELETFPLARAVHAAAIRAGGLPHVEFQSMVLEGDLMRLGTAEQIDWVPEMQVRGLEWADVYIGLRGARNPHEWSSVPAEKVAAHKRAMGKVSALRTSATRWVLSRIPSEALAQEAGMSLDEMMEFYFTAVVRDWQAEARRYNEIRDVFQAATMVRIEGKGTDIAFSTAGRTYVAADGRINMPDGEIFTAPVDDSVEGVITFDFPGVYGGIKIPDIRLEFRKGRIVKASASAHDDLLQKLITMDEGANRVGEFGVGTNFGIQRFCSDILYDEKIGGTVHLALGRAYAECGGTNQSALHWDIIKDLRPGGRVTLDGHPALVDGRFTF
jgi:aminopeptidase